VIRLLWYSAAYKLTWERVLTQPIHTQRRLIAVFAADVEGCSHLMDTDEVGTLRALSERGLILDALISSNRGRIANTASMTEATADGSDFRHHALFVHPL
jgi:class 3 adenylate cyclase